MKQFLRSVLVTMLLVCLTSSCALAYEWDLTDSIFPLSEPITFNILTSGYRGTDIANITENEDWQSLLAQTNVQINFISLGSYDGSESRDNLQTRLLGGDYGDAIMSVYLDTLNAADINDLAEAGMIIPVTKYMYDPAVMPNMYNGIVSTHDAIVKNMKAANGEIYYFAGVSELSAYTAGEAQMMVNTEWMNAWKEARGVDHSPATMDEFEDMLVFFRDSDLNGNGVKDEVPYFITQGGYAGCMTLEHAMGMYGIATKDSTLDMDIQIGDDGKCYYVYTTDTYKEALKRFAKWYSEGLVWEEIFTANNETSTNMVKSAASRIGLYNACENIRGFETILPPSIEGYQARYHMHPGVRLGVRQPYAVITDKCEHPEILASFLDLLFNFDNFMLWDVGTRAFNIGTMVLDENNKYVPTKLPEGTVVEPETDATRAISAFLARMEVNTIDYFNERVDMDAYFGDQARVRGYQLYADNGIWNPTENLWPRCTISEEYAEDYAFMYTDVASTVAQYRAKFVTGELDIDANWDEFQQKLQNLGIEKMRNIIQTTYDEYVNR